MKRIKRLIHEPLVHFLLIGAGLFLLFGLTRESGNDATKRIVISPSQVEQLAAQFKRTWLRQPTEEELAGLIESYVRDEVYYREAMAMGLDRNDPQVRMRMRMKLEFLLEDLTAEEAPDDEVLTAYLREHANKFSEETRVSFRQVFLNPSKHPDFEVDAKRTLEQLLAGAAPESVGDQTLLPYEYRLATQDVIARSFGEVFADDVATKAPGDWTGPIYSRLGIHLVKVSERVDGRLPELLEVRAQVERDYQAERRQELKDKAYTRLLEGYDVVIRKRTDEKSNPGEAVAASRPMEDGQ
jgi:hypothetical protein